MKFSIYATTLAFLTLSQGVFADSVFRLQLSGPILFSSEDASTEDVSIQFTGGWWRQGAEIDVAVTVEGEYSSLQVEGLPPNLLFDPDQTRIYGTTYVVDEYNVTVRALNSAGQTLASAEAIFDIIDGLIATAPSNVNVSENAQILMVPDALGIKGRHEWKWSPSGNSPPPELRVDPLTGVISGRARTVGNHTGLRLLLTDSFDGKVDEIATEPFSINIRSAVPLASTVKPARAHLGNPGSQTFLAATNDSLAFANLLGDGDENSRVVSFPAGYVANQIWMRYAGSVRGNTCRIVITGTNLPATITLDFAYFTVSGAIDYSLPSLAISRTTSTRAEYTGPCSPGMTSIDTTGVHIKVSSALNAFSFTEFRFGWNGVFP